jgi:dTDP-glucose 4,6-dehydratase
MKICVSGALGFIGSAFIRRILETESSKLSIVGFARNTDQRNCGRLESVLDDNRLRIVFGDLMDDFSGLTEGCDAVVHFAARTYVDHSIVDPTPFVESNVLGTLRLLEDARRNKVKRFIQVSTDEVYGSILEGAYAENSPLNPTNPYAASKAGADCLAISYAHTFGLHTVVTRTENNVGPFQHPQKVFPTFVRKALAGELLPVYGDGGHVRQWLWVVDHVDALILLLTADVAPGSVYHIAGNRELKNLDLAKWILRVLHKPEDQIEFIDDHNIRPGHDRRYALCCDKLKALGWAPKLELEQMIEKAAFWYRDNPTWLNA